jgi:hypothetical protein
MSNRVLATALAELAIERHQYGVLRVGVHGEVVVLPLGGKSGLCGGPAFVALPEKHAPDADRDVVVEKEPHAAPPGSPYAA